MVSCSRVLFAVRAILLDCLISSLGKSGIFYLCEPQILQRGVYRVVDTYCNNSQKRIVDCGITLLSLRFWSVCL